MRKPVKQSETGATLTTRHGRNPSITGP